MNSYQHRINTFSKLAFSRTFSRRDTRLGKMEKLYESIDKKSSEGISLGFSLAKIYDDLGDIDKGFALLSEANANLRPAYTNDKSFQLFTQIQSRFSQQTQSAITTHSPKTLLFIVGMPRSGTSLVEQILDTHSNVHARGELPTMSTLCSQFQKDCNLE